MNRRVTTDGTGPSKERRVFAQRLTEKLRERNITGSALAEMVKISRDAVSSYTTMRSLPSKDTLAKIAKILKCKPADLLPQMSEDEINTIIEVREYSKPGMKLLIVRVPLPEAEAWDYAGSITKIAKNGSAKR